MTMKTIVTILKTIFVPISAFSFLLFGLMACFSSAYIEFIVLRELLTIPSSTIDANAWAALIVLILEGSKFTLYFYSESFKKKNLEHDISEFNIKKKLRLINFVKYTLVILSLICSMICVINIMYDNSDQKILAKVNEHNAMCDVKYAAEKANIEQEYTKTINNAVALYSTELKNIENLEVQWNTLLEAIKNESFIRHREDLQLQANLILEKKNEAQANYDALIEKIETAADKVRNENLKLLEKKYGENGSERLSIADAEAQISGDNAYLSNFLLAFTRTFGGETYSRGIYFTCTLLLSVTVSVILELTISISQMLLTLSVDSFVKIIGELPPLIYGKKVVQFCTWLLFSVLISTSAYLICCIISQIDVGTENMAITLLAYLGTILLVNVLTPKSTNHNLAPYLPRKMKSAEPLIHKITEIVLEAIIPAALAFVFSLLLGFLIKNTFDYTNFNALAVAIGGSFANCLRFKQFEFKI